MAYFKLSSENLNSLLGIKENKVKLCKSGTGKFGGGVK